MTLAQLIPGIAMQFVGRHEFPKGSNSGPQLQEFFDADSYDPNGNAPGDSGYAWCASFCCRGVQLAMQAWVHLNPGKLLTFNRPTTPSAFGFQTWSLAQDASTKTITDIRKDTVKAGDIVILKVSHILFAITDSDANGYFESVEGNTNDDGSREGWMVCHKKTAKKRYFGSVRAVVRFTV